MLRLRPHPVDWWGVVIRLCFQNTYIIYCWERGVDRPRLVYVGRRGGRL